jgi:hypothetical protein
MTGWRTFRCACGLAFEEATRDALSPSLTICPRCNEECFPDAHRLDDLATHMGNLTMPWSARVRVLGDLP